MLPGTPSAELLEKRQSRIRVRWVQTHIAMQHACFEGNDRLPRRHVERELKGLIISSEERDGLH